MATKSRARALQPRCMNTLSPSKSLTLKSYRSQKNFQKHETGTRI
jgi:hypothetical protein